MMAVDVDERDSAMRVSRLAGPLLLGVATGCRASLGPAGVAFVPPRRRDPAVLSGLQSPWGRRVSAGLVVGELIGDKLPQTPSRLEPQGLGARLVLGGAGGAALAWRAGAHPLLGALAATAGVGAGAVGGLRMRQAVAARGWPDLPAALAEDAAALGLARTAGRLAARGG